MVKDLYVANISFRATEEDIRKLFAVAGKVVSVHLVSDPATGQFRGSAFVKMTGVTAREVIDTLDGARLVDRVISVSEALPKKPQAARPGGGRRRSG